MTLRKADIIDKIIKETGMTRRDGYNATQSILEVIKSELIKGEDVLISGFGKFYIKDKKERLGRNPSTGKRLLLRARKVLLFKASGKLKETINPHLVPKKSS